jgi:hypothetical protein
MPALAASSPTRVRSRWLFTRSRSTWAASRWANFSETDKRMGPTSVRHGPRSLRRDTRQCRRFHHTENRRRVALRVVGRRKQPLWASSAKHPAGVEAVAIRNDRQG